jgi:DNA-binding NarL/FixJ family response regulator
MKNCRILIADDSALLRKSIKTLLASSQDSSFSCEVCGEAADGRQAIELAKSLRPDVILLDLSLPLIPGLEVAAVLRSEIPSSTIVIMSQQDPSVLRHAARSVDVQHFIPKSRVASDLLPLLSSLS